MAHDCWRELGALGVPTLVVHGDADRLVPTENGRLLAERIRGAELVLIPGAGHMLQADAGETVRETVLAFLERVGRSRRWQPAPPLDNLDNGESERHPTGWQDRDGGGVRRSRE